MTLIRSSCPFISRNISADRSRLPSLTRMSSQASPIESSAAVIRLRSSDRFSSSLKIGTTTLIMLGGVFTTKARRHEENRDVTPDGICHSERYSAKNLGSTRVVQFWRSFDGVPSQDDVAWRIAP